MGDKLLLLQTQDGDWEGLYIEKEFLHDEGHNLGEGDHRSYWFKMGRVFGGDLVIKELNDADNKDVTGCGNFPKCLNELDGDYLSG